MTEIIQNPYYLVAAAAGLAAVGFILAAVWFLWKERPKGEKRKKRFRLSGEKKTEEVIPEAFQQEETVVARTGEITRPKKDETAVSNSDTECYRQQIIQAYQTNSGLLETLNGLLEDESCTKFVQNIKNAREYLQNSRYKDFETALDYLFTGMDAGKLKDDLLQMEIVKHRRIEVHL